MKRKMLLTIKQRVTIKQRAERLARTQPAA